VKSIHLAKHETYLANANDCQRKAVTRPRDRHLLPSARRRSGYRADIGSVGWRQLDHLIDRWAGGAGKQCRLLVGMQTLPQQENAAP
jgi:hypothetical protein